MLENLRKAGQAAVLGLMVIGASGCGEKSGNLGQRPDTSKFKSELVNSNGFTDIDIKGKSVPDIGVLSLHIFSDKKRALMFLCTSFDPNRVAVDPGTVSTAPTSFFGLDNTPALPTPNISNDKIVNFGNEAMTKINSHLRGRLTDNSFRCDPHFMSAASGQFGIGYPPDYVNVDGNDAPPSYLQEKFSLN